MTQPNFNVEGRKGAAYCSHHAADGMGNVYTKRCVHDSCTKQPLYNAKGIKKALYCKEHFGGGMVDVRSLR
ncbi:unnamed protein product [Scytosiphon promiscuus]